MNEELFRGLWSRAVDVDEQLSEEAVPMRVRGRDVWRFLSWGKGGRTHFLLWPPLFSLAADVSLDVQVPLYQLLVPLANHLHGFWVTDDGGLLL